ncbi:MAG: tRNA uridine-5-carboxymethylaminomethyl(34) synthesis GTPase MnmE [Firmicutes bacterium]|nr:tRNA uridine-5-carboxymethylaminomethyl(34) synthesis GTPase MnmE [Bacillota bacterium]
MRIDSTIAAIATPFGNSGIGIVRLSGKRALNIALNIFTPINKELKTLEPRYATFGTLTTKSFSDQVVCTYFKAPNSFTGEDLIEFSCHGGWHILNGILKETLNNGAAYAQNGEFTKRAFLNGKLSLDQCESVIEMIHAESDAAISANFQLLTGKLKKQLDQIQDFLIDTKAKIEVTLDYPEHEPQSISGSLTNALNQIDALLATATTGQIVAGGVNVCIMGLPNAGKSSLFNALLSTDRAIVTNIAGTTRDTLTESYNFKGMKFNLTDTAGLTDTTDTVEKIGVERAKEKLKTAHITLVVLDATTPLNAQEEGLYKLTNNYITVLNKTDLKTHPTKISFVGKLSGSCQEVSALNNVNIDELKQLIYKKTIANPPLPDQLILTNTRHVEALQIAKASIKNALSNSQVYDCVSIDIDDALNAIGQITGTYASEDVIDRIFSKFCLGK